MPAPARVARHPTAEPEPPRPDAHVLALLNTYLDELRLVHNLSPYTLRNYRADITAYLAWLAGRAIAPLRIGRIDFRAYLADLTEAGLARSSLQRKISTVHAFHRYLVREGHLAADPLFGVSSPKKAKRLPRVLEDSDIALLLDAPPADTPQGLRDRAMLELLYAGGLRVSELVRLDLGALNLEDRIVVVRGKGNKQRGVLIGRPARDALQRYLRHARPQLIGRSRTGPQRDAVFLNKAGGRLSARSVQTIVPKWATAAGIEATVHPHLLRHSFATHMLDNGAELRVVQELLGHSSAITTQIYADVTAERQRTVYEAAFFNQLRRRDDEQA